MKSFGQIPPSAGGMQPARPLTGRVVLAALLAFFGTVIAVNVVMMTLAISTMPGIETESPYKAGINYNAEIGAAQDQFGRHLRVSGHIERAADGHAIVNIEARDRSGAPLTNLAFTVRLLRPTDARADRIVAMTEHESGAYRGEAGDVSPGLWEIELEAERGSERIFRSTNRITLE
jgi:nitrogen fixation protein FixH